MKLESLLHEEIKKEIEELGHIELGSNEYKATVDGVTKLLDKAIDIERINIEAEEKEKDREVETNLKVSQMKEDRKNRIVGHILTGVGIAVPTAVTIWGALKSWEFEKTGTVTTMMGRGFINKLLKK